MLFTVYLSGFGSLEKLTTMGEGDRLGILFEGRLATKKLRLLT
jgi:hypothetical protein